MYGSAHRGELAPLTGLRGVTALFVMAFHFSRGDDSGWGLQTFVNHGAIGVDIFFALSGFVMVLAYGRMFGQRVSFGNYVVFVIRRFARIYPLYLLGVLFLAAVTYLDLNSTKLPVNAQLVGANLAMLQNWAANQSYDPPTWSVITECAVYFAFPILLLAVTRLGFRGLASAFAGLMLMTILGIAYPAVSDWADSAYTVGFQGLTRCLCGFATGMLSCLLLDHRGLARLMQSKLAANVSAIVLLALIADPALHRYAVLAIPFVLMSLTGPSLSSRLLSTRTCLFFGQISYSLYLLHWAVHCSQPMVTGYLFPWLPAWAYLLVGSLALIGGSWVVHQWYELPARRAIRGLEEAGRRLLSGDVDPARARIPLLVGNARSAGH